VEVPVEVFRRLEESAKIRGVSVDQLVAMIVEERVRNLVK